MKTHGHHKDTPLHDRLRRFATACCVPRCTGARYSGVAAQRKKSPVSAYRFASHRSHRHELERNVGVSLSSRIVIHVFSYYIRYHDDARHPHRHITGRAPETGSFRLVCAPWREREIFRGGRAGRSGFAGLADAGAFHAAQDGGPGAGLHGRTPAGSGLSQRGRSVPLRDRD